MRFQLVAALLSVLALASSNATAQGQGNSGAKDPGRKAQLERLRGRMKMPGGDGSSTDRQVGPQFDPGRMRSQRATDALGRAAKQDGGTRGKSLLRKQQQQQDTDGTTDPSAGASQRGARRASIDALHQLQQQMRLEMAEIDRMRDTAIETGDVALLEQAELLEQELRLRYKLAFREWHLQHDKGNHYGWRNTPITPPTTTPPTDPTAPPTTDPTAPPATDPTAPPTTDPTAPPTTDPTAPPTTDPTAPPTTDPTAPPTTDPTAPPTTDPTAPPTTDPTAPPTTDPTVPPTTDPTAPPTTDPTAPTPTDPTAPTPTDPTAPPAPTTP